MRAKHAKIPPFLAALAFLSCALSASFAADKTVTETALAPSKPPLETLLKPKTLTRATEDLDVVVNSGWEGIDGFEYTGAMVVRAPIKHARKTITDYAVYPKMSPAIRKFDYDARTKIIEMVAEAGGYLVRSWVKVDDRYWDELNYEIVRGDMKGFKVKTSLWDKGSRTMLVMQGHLPSAKNIFPKALQFIAIPLSEMVLGVASRNFRSYIEGEYNKLKTAR
ncbi:MAG: hypothetical protein HYW49_08160 [Deltaproteobacteria bacterium]|nr:hypothetical protein [Deltaproteobacteria bacterium]